MSIERHVGATLQWLSLEAELRKHNRFFPPSSETFEEFRDRALQSRSTLLNGSNLYRARIMPLGHSPDDGPYPPDMTHVGPPPPGTTPDGRLNPEGIPCLYLASDPETAIAETRPWREAHVTLARFSATRDLPMVDLTADSSDPKLSVLNHVFSLPPHREDRLAYVASQYLAESLKAQGVEAVKYRSAARPFSGTNFGLFSTDYMTPISTELHVVRKVTVTSLRIDPLEASDSGFGV